ncbi:MAG: OmpH family outer membrane protein [Chromatiales bacterium]|nr:OmpH family outer membrane protein [Chromatiales bacterium]
MFRYLLKLFITILIFSLGYVESSVAEELRVAFVNIPQILEHAPQADAVRETLDQEFSARDIELTTGDKKLELMKQRLDRESVSLSEEERRKLERDLLTHEREMKRSHEEYSEDRNIRKNEELAKMQSEIRLSIVNLAKEQGFDLVLESGVMYASQRVDITGQVIDRLKKGYSVVNKKEK